MLKNDTQYDIGHQQIQLNDNQSRSPLLHVMIRDDGINELQNERL